MPNTLLPTLPDAVNKRIKHAITNLQPGDQLHLTAPVLGFPRGLALPVFGFCQHLDSQGNPYAVTAYVNGGPHAVPYTEREARRYPTGQREQWFGSVLMYLTQIDLTDYADCLRLERLPAPLAQLVTPEVPTTQRMAA